MEISATRACDIKGHACRNHKDAWGKHLAGNTPSLCLTLSVAPHVYLYHKSQGQPKSLGIAWCLIIYACHQSL